VLNPNWSARVLAGCLGAASAKSTRPSGGLRSPWFHAQSGPRKRGTASLALPLLGGAGECAHQLL